VLADTIGVCVPAACAHPGGLAARSIDHPTCGLAGIPCPLQPVTPCHLHPPLSLGSMTGMSRASTHRGGILRCHVRPRLTATSVHRGPTLVYALHRSGTHRIEPTAIAETCKPVSLLTLCLAPSPVLAPGRALLVSRRYLTDCDHQPVRTPPVLRTQESAQKLSRFRERRTRPVRGRRVVPARQPRYHRSLGRRRLSGYRRRAGEPGPVRARSDLYRRRRLGRSRRAWVLRSLTKDGVPACLSRSPATAAAGPAITQ